MILGIPTIGFIVRHLLQYKYNLFFLFFLFHKNESIFFRCDSLRIKSLGIHCFGMWVIAVTIWICDRMFCSFWLSISFPYLHSLWHVLILFSSNEAIVICGYLTIKQQNPQANLHLHFWPNEKWNWFTLPYLKFHDDDNDGNLSTKLII